MNITEQKAQEQREQAAEWCMAHLDDILSPSEAASFEDWMSIPGNAAALRETAQMWQDIGQVAEWPETIKMRTQALQSFGEANGARWRTEVNRRWQWLGASAALFLLVAIGFVLWPRPAIYQTAIGERQIATLADGSRLSLDGDSEVLVKLGDDVRELTLVRGRARFDVAKDAKRPFVVMAAGRAVLATGTQFSVELVNNALHVVLIEGHVAVVPEGEIRAQIQALRHHPTGLHPPHLLEPGQELVDDAKSVSFTPAIVRVDVPHSLAWENGQLVFEDIDLGTAVLRVNRYSHTQIEITDPVASKAHVSGVFTQGDAASFAEAAAALNGLKVSHRDGHLILSSRGRQ